MKKTFLLGLIGCLIVVGLSAQDTTKVVFPCFEDEKYSPLDFWLGEWDVYYNDQLIATSSITKSEGGCTLHENYVTARGYTGRSLNYYDPTDSLYKQLWIDKGNGISKYRMLEARAGYVLMETYGHPPLIRMSYKLDAEKDEVTQTLLQSEDEGQSWKNVFTGIYKRQKGTIAPPKEWLSTNELLQKSRAWHDPNNRWRSWSDTLHFVEPRTRNHSRATLVIIDNTKESFYFERAYGEDLVAFGVGPTGCQFSINGNSQLTQEQIDQYRLSCERAAGYQSFYTFLYGLPMSLDKYEWTAKGPPRIVNFRGQRYWSQALTIEGAVFSDDWILYFDPVTYGLSAYEYQPAADAERAGEYLLLDDFLEKGGVKFPRMRRWYDRGNDEFLGSDIGF
ncbi:MAG: DUF6503 family protein [Bacteroidota bacterium]